MPTSAHRWGNSELFHSVLFWTVVVITTTCQLSRNEQTSGSIAPVGGKMKLCAPMLLSKRGAVVA
eukprot:10030290-Alexandrium_andersonii.AAC.1